MLTLLAIEIGGLYAAGLYLMLRRSAVKMIFGLALLGHAANLLIFTVGGLRRGEPPLIREGDQSLSVTAADPLPQALVLTAIVIGFAVVSFAAVLVKRACDTVGTDDVDEMRTTER